MQTLPTPHEVSPFLQPDPEIEARIRSRGETLFKAMDAHPAPGIFSSKGAYAKVMDWAMRDPAFKTQMFRFVDVLPALDSSAEIVRHLKEYLGDKAVELNPALKAGLGAASFAPALVAAPVKSQVVAMARQFVAGETVEDLIKQFRRNAAAGLATTIDLLGEAVLSKAEADIFVDRNLEVLNAFARELKPNDPPCPSDIGADGRPLPRLNLSVKISALSPDVQPAAPEISIAVLKNRLRPIFRRAGEIGAFINFDMESYRLKDLTLALFRAILEEEEFRAAPQVGIALQAYLRDTERDLLGLLAWLRSRGRRIGIRLVKGAYWDSETVLALQRDWPCPVWSQKAETDANYEKLSLLLLRNLDVADPAFASHNVRSCAHAIAQAERLGIDPKAYEFQALYGMADDLKAALRQQGHRVREYCAVGDLLPGMAYLVRRLLENTSNEGFLRQSHTGEASREKLLADPRTQLAPTKEPSAKRGFVNAANADFSKAPARQRMQEALAKVSASIGKTWPLVIGGKRPSTAEIAASVNPARPSQIVGFCSQATIEDASAALAAARKTFPTWAATAADERAEVLERAADLMEARRAELSVLLTLEAGKAWPESDGEVSEAIDFCRFYASEMRKLARPCVTQLVPGESCTRIFVPRGVGVIVSPWNFPLAILCGLTVAPLVAGNTVIVKPSRQTPIIAATFVDILQEAGAPAGTVNLTAVRLS